MALVLTEEQSLLRDSARGLIGDKAPVSHLRHLRDSRDATGFSRELWKSFAEMGFAGLLVPDDFGGSGLGCVEAGVVMEEIGRTLMPSPFLSTAVLAATALSRGGSAAQKKEYLAKMAGGQLIASLAVDEGAKHRPAQTAMQAVRSGNGFKLNGAKALVVDGHVSDLLIVAARSAGKPGERDGLTLFLVDPKAKGVAIELTAMVDVDDPIGFARITTRAVRTIAHGSGNGLLVELVTDLANQTVWSTIWKSPLDYSTREIRREAAVLMTQTLESIRQRNPDAAVASLGRLLEDDRDRALATLSDLRKETFSLSAISQT